MDHLELLHHYELVTYRAFGDDNDVASSYRETAISTALRFPFVMYAILGLSAIHLCRLRPGRAQHYLSLSSSLQASGLTGLNDTLLNINEDNCVAVFIFSSTIGLHSFCDTFNFRDQKYDNFNQFLDKLTNCIHLLRGVRSVMDGGWWDYLRTETALGDLLATGHILETVYRGREGETKPLWDLISVADIGPHSLKTYEEAIEQLQKVLAAQSKLEHLENVSMIFAWPVMLSAEYNELLIQRRPEALVILAFYGVLLYRRRESWAVGDAGKFVVQSVSDYLGKHWERWLEWPKSEVLSSFSLPTVSTPG